MSSPSDYTGVFSFITIVLFWSTDYMPASPLGPSWAPLTTATPAMETSSSKEWPFWVPSADPLCSSASEPREQRFLLSPPCRLFHAWGKEQTRNVNSPLVYSCFSSLSYLILVISFHIPGNNHVEFRGHIFPSCCPVETGLEIQRLKSCQ